MVHPSSDDAMTPRERDKQFNRNLLTGQRDHEIPKG